MNNKIFILVLAILAIWFFFVRPWQARAAAGK